MCKESFLPAADPPKAEIAPNDSGSLTDHADERYYPETSGQLGKFPATRTTINSNPPGAVVKVKNKHGMVVHSAVTPSTLSLKASAGFFQPASYSFEFQKKGYYAGSAAISAGMDPWYIGNIVCGGLIGIVIVDPATGAMWKLDDNVYGSLTPDRSFQTTKAAPVAQAPKTQVASAGIASRLKELKELKEAGVLTDEEYETKRIALAAEL